MDCFGPTRAATRAAVFRERIGKRGGLRRRRRIRLRGNVDCKIEYRKLHLRAVYPFIIPPAFVVDRHLERNKMTGPVLIQRARLNPSFTCIQYQMAKITLHTIRILLYIKVYYATRYDPDNRTGKEAHRKDPHPFAGQGLPGH